jgi:hypothetical protein
VVSSVNIVLRCEGPPLLIYTLSYTRPLSLSRVDALTRHLTTCSGAPEREATPGASSENVGPPTLASIINPRPIFRVPSMSPSDGQLDGPSAMFSFNHTFPIGAQHPLFESAPSLCLFVPIEDQSYPATLCMQPMPQVLGAYNVGFYPVADYMWADIPRESFPPLFAAPYASPSEPAYFPLDIPTSLLPESVDANDGATVPTDFTDLAVIGFDPPLIDNDTLIELIPPVDGPCIASTN